MLTTMGIRLKKLRQARGLHQVDVAESIGVARSYLTHIENDRREGALKHLVALADFYEVSLDYLIRGAESSKADDDSQISKIWKTLSKEEQKSFLMLLNRVKS